MVELWFWQWDVSGNCNCLWKASNFKLHLLLKLQKIRGAGDTLAWSFLHKTTATTCCSLASGWSCHLGSWALGLVMTHLLYIHMYYYRNIPWLCWVNLCSWGYKRFNYVTNHFLPGSHWKKKFLSLTGRLSTQAALTQWRVSYDEWRAWQYSCVHNTHVCTILILRGKGDTLVP